MRVSTYDFIDRLHYGIFTGARACFDSNSHSTDDTHQDKLVWVGAADKPITDITFISDYVQTARGSSVGNFRWYFTRLSGQVLFLYRSPSLSLSLSLSLRHGIAGRGEAMFGLVCVVHLGTPPWRCVCGVPNNQLCGRKSTLPNVCFAEGARTIT